MKLQYRKRYELLQLNMSYLESIKETCYNTASGMSCCNMVICVGPDLKHVGYNTASGMSCCN